MSAEIKKEIQVETVDSCSTPLGLARLKIDAIWDPIRNDTSFQKLLSEPEPATIYK
jgi:hypothetical protein